MSRFDGQSRFPDQLGSAIYLNKAYFPITMKPAWQEPVKPRILMREFWQKNFEPKGSRNGVIWPNFSCPFFVPCWMSNANGMLKFPNCHWNTLTLSSHIQGDVQKISSQSDIIQLEKKAMKDWKSQPKIFWLFLMKYPYIDLYIFLRH